GTTLNVTAFCPIEDPAQPPPLITVTDKLPTVDVVNVTDAVPFPDEIVAPDNTQVYVAPAPASGTDAVTVVPGQNAGGENVIVTSGRTTLGMVIDDEAEQPSNFVTVTNSVTEEAPVLNVTTFVVEALMDPPPPPIDHWYVAPGPASG